MTKQERQKFIRTVMNHYEQYGRHELPWRLTTDPYHILVSEVMLQQTQVERVLPKYKDFMERWGTAEALAQASLAEVLKVWQGLGYNSRAKRLHECAKVVVKEFGGEFPDTFEGLKSLPGIGPYTAGAIMAFAYNKGVPLIETNVRTVYIHHFFNDATDVEEGEILKLVEEALDTKEPRQWYWALMDYGAHIKKEHGNPNSRAKAYVRQSKFEGSDRQIRGAIIRVLSNAPRTRLNLHKDLRQFDVLRIDVQLEKLLTEGLIVKVKTKYSLPE